ncbi:hypothetical protein [Croceivirga thetidis]|uniref:Uncharacterized protein n=1 Tax=Croceivirga thetidis TaxID=2721623 RepID=A0ABX1GQA6_9FLAO|nr:hypothetical protein [Croceivirga thetidis]NKI31256.1 hypothetical protein [Croceivirga thetidis]
MEKILSIFRGYSLGRTKVALFGLFISAIGFQFYVNINFEKGQIIANDGEIPLFLWIAIIFFFSLLILLDFWFYRDNSKRKKKIIDLLENENVDNEIKLQISKKLDRLL